MVRRILYMWEKILITRQMHKVKYSHIVYTYFIHVPLTAVFFWKTPLLTASMDEDGKVSVNTVSTVADISFKYGTILLLPPDNAWTELSDVHSLQHVTSGTGERQKAGEECTIGERAGKRERLRESPMFLCMLFIKASSLIASDKVTGSFMSAAWVPALVCVARQ